MDLIFLKLGGSLITDKHTPHTARQQTIARLAEEIAAARGDQPSTQIVLGHGSGSFGHVPAKAYGTRQGVNSPEGWRGFVAVWREAAALNRLVMDALHQAGLPAVAFPPSGGVTTRKGQVTRWNLSPLLAALEAGLLPTVYGDVVFDETLGGTILSTEDLFVHLAKHLKPQRILLAGLDEGVWEDYPDCTRLIPDITPQNWPQFESALGTSAAVDVTGGMAGKVREMLSLITELPTLEVQIFSGQHPGRLKAALLGECPGTRLRAV